MHADAERGGQFDGGRGPAQRAGQLDPDALDVAGPLADRAGGPVQAAQRIHEGALDPDRDEAGERYPVRRVVRLGRGDQRQQPGGGQVVPADMARYPVQRLADQVPDQRDVAPDLRFQRPVHLRGSGHVNPS